LDRNFYQSIKKTEETLALEPLKNKLNSFGFCVLEGNGHDFNFLRKALKTKSDKPKFIIANTIKGKGVDYMENNISWHYKFPNIIESESAISQIIKNK
jgi:transketolase